MRKDSKISVLNDYGFTNPLSVKEKYDVDLNTNHKKYDGGLRKMAKEKVFKKIESKIVKFENEGDTVQGILISKDIGHTYNNEVYKIKDDSGDTLTVFSTTVMQTLMSEVKIGDYIKIVYVGTKENDKKGQQDIRLFEVSKAE